MYFFYKTNNKNLSLIWEEKKKFVFSSLFYFINRVLFIYIFAYRRLI